MNNLYYDYIGAKGNYEINDYIDTEIKTTSNILDTKINFTSNILNTNINTTSNYLRGYTDTNITNLDNYYNKIVNIKNVYNWLGNNTNTNHTYITNSNFTDAYSEIRFLSVNSINYPNQPNTNMIFPTYFSPPTYHKVKIGNDGKLYVFYQFDASINATLPSMWIDVNQEYGKIVADAVNKGFVIAQLELSVAYCLDNIVSGSVAGAGSLGYSMVDDPRNIATASTGTPSLLLNIWNTFKAGSSVAGIALAGVAGGLALYVPIYGIFSGINYNSYFNQVLANMNKNRQSNLDIGNTQTANDIQINMNYTCNLIYSNVVETSKYFSNLSLNLGFINSNITTSQIISNLNTYNLSIDGVNVSNNIYINSNICSNGLYLNSNLSFNTSNSFSNQIKNLNTYSSNVAARDIYVSIPNTNFRYDNTNSLYFYDLYIEKYVPSIDRGGGYKERAFEISSFRPLSDWNTKNNLLINNEYINYPEKLTFYMNNNSNYLGISTANNNYTNCLIQGKTGKDTNIGYWNSLSLTTDGYNYIRYLSKAGFDLNCSIRNLLS
jgi:hypothetical protein